MEKNENFKEQLEKQYNILIQANAKQEKLRYTIILTIVLITFITVLIGVVFSYRAYASSKKINTETSEETQTYYRTLATIFNTGPNLNLSKIGNGFQLATPKIIQITNEGNTEITFDIKLTSINTSLLSTNNLIYTLTRENETSVNKVLPLNDKVIVQDITINPSETITYIMNVKFTGVIEENNYSNYYNSKIEIVQKNNKSDLLE